MRYIFSIIHHFHPQVTTRALEITTTNGDNNIEKVLEEGGDTAPASLSLNDLPNMVDRLLAPSHCFGPCLRKSMFFLKKPGIATFQTWALRDPSVTIFGLILGHEGKPGKWVTTRIVCSTSWDDLMDTDKIKTICDKEQIQMVGVICKGQPHHAESRSLGLQLCHKLMDKTGRDSLFFVFVSWSIYFLFPTFNAIEFAEERETHILYIYI